MTVIEDELRAELIELKLLPIQEGRWKKVDFRLYSNSTREEYDEVKQKIHIHVPRKTKGIYVLTKGKEVLYIGESGNSTQRRMIRHIDKIYSRTDERSRFFKQRQHQGDLTYYHFELPSLSSAHRKLIEESMNMVIKPAYLTWTVRFKLQRLNGHLSTDVQ